MVGQKSCMALTTRLTAVMAARMTNQNQRTMYIFSLRMFMPSTQSASNRWMVPEPPYLWKIHCATKHVVVQQDYTKEI